MRKKAKSNSSPVISFPNFKTIIFVLVAVFVFTLEEAAKLFLMMESGKYVCNSGFAFGLGFLNSAASTVVSSVFIIFSVVLFFKVKQDLAKLGSALIVGGGFANLSDRIVEGCVTDYIKIFPFFPRFNIADIAITMGFVILIISLFSKGKNGNEKYNY